MSLIAVRRAYEPERNVSLCASFEFLVGSQLVAHLFVRRLRIRDVVVARLN